MVFIRPSCLVQLQPERFWSRAHCSPSSHGSIPHHCRLAMSRAAGAWGRRGRGYLGGWRWKEKWREGWVDGGKDGGIEGGVMDERMQGGMDA